MRRRQLMSVALPLVIIAVSIVAATAPSLLAPYNPLATNFAARLEPLGSVINGHVHLLGTDALGRDVLSRLIYGTRVSMLTALAAVVAAGAVGGVLGIVAGYYRRGTGVVLMRFSDTMMAIPFLLLAILIVTELGPSLRNTIIAMVVTTWPVYARIAYATTLKTAQAEFVDSARALGSSSLRILVRHIVPHVLSSLIVIATLQIGAMILYEAGLSFLGLGVQPPTPSWGAMLSDGEDYIASAWWLITFPGLALFALVWAVNNVGDYVQLVLNPQLRA